MRSLCKKSVFAFSVAIAAVPSIADEREGSGLPLWEIGAFGVAVSQQAYPGAAERVNRGLALPYLIYRGEFLRADRGSAGIRALKTPTLEVDVGVAGSFGSNANDIEVRRGMPELGTRVEFGPRLKWNIGQGPGNGRLRAEFPLRGVFDLNDGLAHKGMTFEPRLIFEGRASGGWGYNTSIGALWGDRRLADTFYGVAPVHATPQRTAYVAESGLVAWRLSAEVSRHLSPDLRLFGFARADSVAGAANEASPLVQRKAGTSVGLGLAYTWKRSDRRAAD